MTFLAEHMIYETMRREAREDEEWRRRQTQLNRKHEQPKEQQCPSPPK